MQIGGFQKSSLLDYPGKISAIIFTKGCNFRCGYCHNPELVLGRKGIQSFCEDSILDFLKTRKGKLDGVVITGGEPCLQKDLVQFIEKVRALGFLVKLDTNGTRPEVVENLLAKGLLDYIAMDIKAPVEKYVAITNSANFSDEILKSIALIIKSGIGYEFRTTVVKSMLDFDDFVKIGELIRGAERYYLQKFVPSKTLDEKFMSSQTYTDEEFKQIICLLSGYIKEVCIR